MTFVLSTGARVDLLDISRSVADHDPTLARRLVETLMTRAQEISTFPEAGAVADRYRDLNLRRVVLRPYVIFYRIDPAQITIVRILHGARDFDPLLREET